MVASCLLLLQVCSEPFIDNGKRHFSVYTVEAGPQFTLTQQFGRQKLKGSADVYLGELLSSQ